MAVQITIRKVPKGVCDEPAAPDAFQCQSMQEFVCSELERIGARASLRTWVEFVRHCQDAAGTRVDPAGTPRTRDVDRQ